MAGIRTPLQLRISDFIKGQYGVVAVMVSYGALLGKVNPQQMMLIVMVNVTAYCANKFLCKFCLRFPFLRIDSPTLPLSLSLPLARALSLSHTPTHKHIHAQ